MIEELELLSCHPERLYGEGGFYDGVVSLDRLRAAHERYGHAVEVIAELFPPCSVERRPALELSAHSFEFLRTVRTYFEDLDRSARRAAPVLLVRISEAIVWNNMVFAVASNRVIPIYEFYRQNDRAEKGQQLLSRLAAAGAPETLNSTETRTLFIGSAGSFNYGHWLVDDLPALAAVDLIRSSSATLTIVCSKYGTMIDKVRTDGLRLLLGEDDTILRMQSRDVPLRVRNLYYVTPSTYHAHLKHPAAIDFVRSLIRRAVNPIASAVESQYLYIGRPAEFGRQLVNELDVLHELKRYGFEEYQPERFPIGQQWATFASAREVIGVMGAAMTSVLLLPPRGSVTLLAPAGWLEPFYWDLCAVRSQTMRTIYGEPVSLDAPPHRSSFRVQLPVSTFIAT